MLSAPPPAPVAPTIMNFQSSNTDTGASGTSGFPAAEIPIVQSANADVSKALIFEHAITDQLGPLTVSEAVARYLTLRVTEGLNPAGDTYSHQNKHLAQRLCSLLGKTLLRNIRADHLRAWAATLKDERTGRPLAQLTVRHHLISVKTFFRRCWREGWVERDPTLPLVLPQIPEEDVNVIPVRDAFEFFRVNRTHRAVGRLALEAFGGIRNSTAGKLVKGDIKFERRGIEMPSTKHKSTKRRFRQGQPANLWEWLKAAPDECWELKPRQYRDEKKEMLVLAGLRALVLKTDAERAQVKELQNVWRHSFASYLLAKAKDYAPVAYLMQHAKATTTEVYEGVADEWEAILYFSITPESVRLPWEAFCELVRTTSTAPTAAAPLV